MLRFISGNPDIIPRKDPPAQTVVCWRTLQADVPGSTCSDIFGTEDPDEAYVASSSLVSRATLSVSV